MDCAERSLLRFFLRPPARYLLAWFLAVTAAAITWFIAWTRFDTPNGGNYGHATIDFGGQWLMGRMLVRGLGRHLYHRNYLRKIAREAYPDESEIPAEEIIVAELDPHKADNLMRWLMGRDDPKAAKAIASLLAPLAGQDILGATVFARALVERMHERVCDATVPQVGGALYPPIHVLVMSPLALLPPAPAYRLVQELGILLALVAGAGICVLSQGRIWWPVGVAGVILFPGFACALNLGQNSIVLLTLLIWGWVFLARNRPGLAGMAWGLLAFKPVWAAAFFLVPLVTRRWQVCLSMLLTALALAAVTVPWVGWQSWVDWLHVGRLAAGLYDSNRNWIFLSRDLINIPRRWLLDFTLEDAQRKSLAATVIGWALLFSVVAGTAFLSILRKEQSRAVTGPPAAFLLLGAWMSCYHFMYYDILLTALPIALLLEARHKEKGTLLQTGYRNRMILTLIALLVISDLLLPLLEIEITISAPILKKSPIPLPIVFSTAYAGTPWPTFCILALWLWCGWLWLRMPRNQSREPDHKEAG
jgi:hypothetical protein